MIVIEKKMMKLPQGLRRRLCRADRCAERRKSTLLNRPSVASWRSSPQRQTTRTRLLGIAIEGVAQLVFVDTPGIAEPRRRLDRAMVAAAWAGRRTDQAVLLVDAAHAARRGVDADTGRIIERIVANKRRAILALSKIDLVQRDRLLA